MAPMTTMTTMTTMKLHWSPKSPYVRKVMVCAHELGIFDRLELVRSVAAMLKPNPAIMVDNPLSKIPTLELEDGRCLFDSHVICRWADMTGDTGPRLFPDGAAGLVDDAVDGGSPAVGEQGRRVGARRVAKHRSAPRPAGTRPALPRLAGTHRTGNRRPTPATT